MKPVRFNSKKMGAKAPFLKPFMRTHSNRRKILEKSGKKDGRSVLISAKRA